MNFTFYAWMALFIGVPAIAGLVKLRFVNSSYRPFFTLLVLGFATEIAGLVFIKLQGNNHIVYNAFGIVSGLLILRQLWLWDRSKQRYMHYRILMGLFVGIALIEAGSMGSINVFLSYFQIIQSFIILVMSSHILSQRLRLAIHYIYRDPIFLICAAWIIFFSYAFLAEFFYLYSLRVHAGWVIYIAVAFSVVNCIVNVIYLYAILCIPPKIPFLLQRSLPAYFWL